MEACRLLAVCPVPFPGAPKELLCGRTFDERVADGRHGERFFQGELFHECIHVGYT